MITSTEPPPLSESWAQVLERCFRFLDALRHLPATHAGEMSGQLGLGVHTSGQRERGSFGQKLRADTASVVSCRPHAARLAALPDRDVGFVG